MKFRICWELAVLRGWRHKFYHGVEIISANSLQGAIEKVRLVICKRYRVDPYNPRTYNFRWTQC
ncbi:MAG: hypothetical protein ACFFC7_09840 [Candidatus Hermodarchaeota archaeon]